MNYVLHEAQAKIDNTNTLIKQAKKLINSCRLNNFTNEKNVNDFYFFYFLNDYSNEKIDITDVFEIFNMYNGTLNEVNFSKNMVYFVSLFKGTYSDTPFDVIYKMYHEELDNTKNKVLYLNRIFSNVNMMYMGFKAIFDTATSQISFNDTVVPFRQKILGQLNYMLQDIQIHINEIIAEENKSSGADKDWQKLIESVMDEAMILATLTGTTLQPENEEVIYDDGAVFFEDENPPRSYSYTDGIGALDENAKVNLVNKIQNYIKDAKKNKDSDYKASERRMMMRELSTVLLVVGWTGMIGAVATSGIGTAKGFETNRGMYLNLYITLAGLCKDTKELDSIENDIKIKMKKLDEKEKALDKNSKGYKIKKRYIDTQKSDGTKMLAAVKVQRNKIKPTNENTTILDESVKDAAITAKNSYDKLQNMFDNKITTRLNKLKKDRQNMKHSEMVGESMRINREIKRVLKTLPIALISPAVAAIIYVGGLVIDKKTDKQDRAELINDVKFEIKVLDEKIADADRNNDMKAKIKLMREKDKLERFLVKVQANNTDYNKIVR